MDQAIQDRSQAADREFLSGADIDAWTPTAQPHSAADRYAPLRQALIRAGQFGPAQMAGRLFPVACVALEVTQRCNLDCSLCYLSERAEMVHDLPLAELFRRIDTIRQHYGPATNIQITGGDPTLRSAQDLREIVAYIRASGMRSALFTNGIRATRELLADLAAAGLNDVAFHIDMTQGRRGFGSEAQLNRLRRDYLDRTRGLGLRVHFNTTVFDGNVGDVPGLMRFFAAHARDIHLVSFQLQAETGRGALGARDDALVSQEKVAGLIEAGLGTPLPFGAIAVGHNRCNRYADVALAGGQAVPLHADSRFAADLLQAVAGRPVDWNDGRQLLRAAILACLRRPRLGVRGLRWTASLFWRLRAGLWRSMRRQSRFSRLAIFIHNFMDAAQLEEDRCQSCVFMVATARGPLSMCVHNARRDAFTFEPVASGPAGWMFNPATGELERTPTPPPATIPRKKQKGRARQPAAEDV